MQSLEGLLAYAKSFLGVPYKFGGNNRLDGLDCSGFIIELMTRQGLWPYGVDASAQGIFDFYTKQPSDGTIFPQKGALAFYGKDSDHIVHIAFCLDENTIIEAGAGDHTTLTLEDAKKRGAVIRERPIKFRKDYFCCLLPKYE